MYKRLQRGSEFFPGAEAISQYKSRLGRLKTVVFVGGEVCESLVVIYQRP